MLLNIPLKIISTNNHGDICTDMREYFKHKKCYTVDGMPFGKLLYVFTEDIKSINGSLFVPLYFEDIEDLIEFKLRFL